MKNKTNKTLRKILSIALCLALVMNYVPMVSITASAVAAADITVTIDTGDKVTLQDTDGDYYYEIGTADELYGVNRVVLTVDDIKEYFDCEYHRFIQGACTHKSKIYSVEGFSAEGDKPPVLLVINPADKKQELYFNLVDNGLTVEPELIDFSGDTCYYSDALGNLYIIDFE